MSLQRIFFIIFTIAANLSVADDVLPPISVTASKTPIATDEIGGSLTIIDETQIENRQVPFVADLLRDAPGTAISQNGGAGTLTQLRLRGAEANHTLVLIDGVEANDLTTGSEFNFANLFTCGLERIEILRGPQSSLWGSDALAGVVNVQSKRGSGPLTIESAFNSGRFDTRQNCTGLSAGNDLHHFSAYGSFYENNGTNISEQGGETDGFRNTTFNLNYGITPTDNLEFNFTGRHVDSTIETDPSSSGLPTDGNNETESFQNYARFSSKLHTFDDAWTHQANLSLTDTDNSNAVAGAETTTNNGQKLKFDYQTNFFYSTSNIDHVLTLAYERERERFEQTGTASSFGDPNQRQKIYNTGYVGEYRSTIVDQLFLTASVRRDNNDEFDNSTTYRLSTAYAPENLSTRFHGAYATGVKNPSFTERFGFTPDTFFGNPDIKPEESKGWEIGFTHTFSDFFSFGATYFSEELEDEINGFSFDSGLGGFTAINLEGESDRKGLELSFDLNPIDKLNIIGTYTYVDSRQPDTSGKATEIRVPRNTASLITNYNFLENRANINMRINYIDDQFDNDFSTFPSTRVELGDYTLVNVAGEYQINNFIALTGRVENLFNKDYQDVFGFETQGINAHIGLNFSTNFTPR